MLKNGGISDPSVRIKDAKFPMPFAYNLEFNSPAHGTWNIVHMGMNIPEAHQIYVCAYNCLRGVVLTAAEMNAEDRFSYVIIDENDMIAGELEDITIEGVTGCLNKLDRHPPVVLLFTVCVHHFLGCDLDYIYGTLEKRFPDIYFARCFMDCLLQKRGLTPEQKLRNSMYDPIPKQEPKKGLVSLIGSDLPLDEDSDLRRLAREAGVRLLEIGRLNSYDEYLEMGKSEFFIADYPTAAYGSKNLGERMERESLYLPMSFTYEEIEKIYRILCNEFRIIANDEEIANRIIAEKSWCEKEIEKTKSLVKDREIRIDYTYHPRPLGLAKLLLEHGFRVSTVYLDSINGEEETAFLWLQEHAPDLLLVATNKPECRVMKRNNPEVLAIGQKAAWFSGTRHFVNVVQGGGLYGYDGIRKTMEYIRNAHTEESDTKDLIIRKGWGCESCV